MPVFNSARTLKEAIESVLKQTYEDFELIICNDASTDETRDILNNFKDDRVRVIHNTTNIGQGKSRDRAISISRGIWGAVIDADDFWSAERLETILQEILDSENEIIFDDIMECHDTISGLVPWRVLRGKYAFGGKGNTTIDVPIAHFIASKRLLIKPVFPLELVRKNQIHHCHRRFGEDTNFFLKLFSHGLKLRYIPKPMYYYRITPASSSSLSSRATMMREVLEEAIVTFGHAPEVQTSLRKKIIMVNQDVKYLPFILAIRKKKFHEAFQMAWHSPRIISDLFSRLWLNLNYHIHRIRHKGHERGNR